MPSEWNRLWVTPVLPYRPGTFEPDHDGLRGLLDVFLQDSYIDAGIGLVINPEAGEVTYLSREEKKTNVAVAVEHVNGRVPIIAGVAHPTTAGAVESAQDAIEAGADGLFLMPPMGALDVTISWNAVRYPEVIVDMWKAIAEAVGDRPLVAHPTGSFSAQYAVGLPVEATRAVIEAIPTIVGWKMTYNYDGYRKVARLLRTHERHVSIFAAPGEYFHENLATGQFDGTVSGSFNYAIEPMIEHIQAWRRGDLDAARRIWDGGLAELHEYVYSDYSRLHIRYKIAAWVRGYIEEPFMRPPLPEPMRDELDTLHHLLDACQLPVRSKDEIRELSARLKR